MLFHSVVSVDVNYRMPSAKSRPALAVLLAAVLWGTTGTAQALGPDETSAFGVGALRLLVGAVSLVVTALLSGATAHQPWRRCLRPLLAGGLAVAAYQLMFFVSTRRAGVAVATVVTIGSAPVFSALVAIARGRGLAAPAAAATAVTIAGVALLGLSGTEGSDAAGAARWGIVAALLAGAGYAAYAELGREAMDRGMHSTTAMAGLFTVGAAAAAFVLPWQPLGWVASASGLVMLVHLGVVTLAVAYVSFGWGLHRLPVPTVVTLTLAEPLVAALLAVVVLDERLSAAGWAGVGVVVLGLALTGRAARAPDTGSAAPTDYGRPP